MEYVYDKVSFIYIEKKMVEDFFSFYIKIFLAIDFHIAEQKITTKQNRIK